MFICVLAENFILKYQYYYYYYYNELFTRLLVNAKLTSLQSFAAHYIAGTNSNEPKQLNQKIALHGSSERRLSIYKSLIWLLLLLLLLLLFEIVKDRFAN